MDAVKKLREEVKKYIDTADPKVVKMMHAMLETDAETDADWWNEMPDQVKADVKEAIRQADNGETISHEEAKRKYAKWFAR